jgi:hypothetical protein
MKSTFTRSFFVLAILTFLLAAVVSLFASSQPDGLERVAIDGGFIEKEDAHWSFALLPDYSVSWMSDHWLGKTIAGILGLVVMFSFVWVLFKWLARKPK